MRRAPLSRRRPRFPFRPAGPLLTGLLLALLLVPTASAGAANGAGGFVGTIAGNGTSGFAGDGGLATGLELNNPTGVAVDSAGDVAIADTANNRVELVPAATGTYFGQPMIAGALYTIAGTGSAGTSANGTALASALVNAPKGVAFDPSGNLFIVDTGAHCVQAASQSAGTVLFGVTLSNANAVYTVAGTCGSSGNGATGTLARNAALSSPAAAAFDANGNLYLVDTGNNCIRAVSSSAGTSLFGVTLTIANAVYPIVGSCGQVSASASADATANGADAMRSPSSLDFDSAGDLIFDDAGNSCVRATSTNSQATVFGVKFHKANNVYTVFGNCNTSGDSASGAANTSTSISTSSWITIDASDNLYVDDSGNNCLRASSPVGNRTLFGTTLTTANNQYWLAGACGTSGTTTNGSAPTATRLGTPNGVAVATNLYLVDSGQDRALVIPATTGNAYGQSMTASDLYAIAGNGTGGYLGSGASAAVAELAAPADVAADSSGNLYIADATNNRIRMVAAANCASSCRWGLPSTYAGSIYTIVGSGTSGSSANGTAITSAKLTTPDAIAFDGSGNLYIANTGASCIQAVSQSAGTSLFGVTLSNANAVYDVAGVCGTSGNGANGGAATSVNLSSPKSLAFDGSGRLFIADTTNACVRAMASSGSPTLYGTTLTSTNHLYAVVGTCGTSGTASPNGTSDTTAQLSGPTSVGFDTSGNLYVDDTANSCVRATPAGAGNVVLGTTLTNAGSIYTVLGTCGTAGSPTNGQADTSTTLRTPGRILLDGSNNLLVADTGNHCIEATSPSAGTKLFGTTLTNAGGVYILAGTCGTSGSTGDGSFATSAKFSSPASIALSNGNLFVADTGNNRVRALSSASSPGLFAYLFPYAIYPALTLSGVDQSSTGYLVAHVVPDPNWSVQLTATSFTGGGHTLSGALTVQSATFTCDSGATCSAPTNGTSYPLTVVPNSATNVFTDSTGAGIGTLSLALRLAIPANTYAATYTSTWTVSSNAGP